MKIFVLALAALSVCAHDGPIFLFNNYGGMPKIAGDPTTGQWQEVVVHGARVLEPNVIIDVPFDPSKMPVESRYYLSLRYCTLKYMPRMRIQGEVVLVHDLGIQYWDGTSVNSDFFGTEGLDFRGIEISYSSLKSLDVDTFIRLRHSQYLALAWNKLQDIPPLTFRGLRKLIFLHLSWNRLLTISPEWFLDLHSLKHLDLAGNFFEEIPVGSFDKLVSLQEVVLNNNRISVIGARLFINTPALKSIAVSNNQMWIVENGALAHLTRLETVDFHRNYCYSRMLVKATMAEVAAAMVNCRTPCVIPPMKNGRVTDGNYTKYVSYDRFLSQPTVLSVSCNEGASLSLPKHGKNENLCLEDHWIYDWATCDCKYLKT